MVFGLYDFAKAENQRWSLKIQCLVLYFMLTNGLGPYQVGFGKNGCPYYVPPQTISRWRAHYMEYGEPPAKTREYVGKRGRRRVINNAVRNKILEIVSNNPALYLDEIQEQLHGETNTWFSLQAISNCLIENNFTRKVMEERAVQASLEEQRLYKYCLSLVPDPRMLMFIDETHKSRGEQRRRRGRGRAGERVYREVLFNRELNYTMIGAVDINGFFRPACEVIFKKRSSNDRNPSRGTVDAARFTQYVEECVVPYLGNFDNNEPRSVVVMDNASIHKDRRVVELIEGAGARIIWTAAYSPWLNPIERCFSVYKAKLKRLERVRNVYQRHLEALDSVGPETMYNLYRKLECINNLHLVRNNEEEEVRRRRKRRRNNMMDNIILALIVKRRRGEI